MADKTFAQLFAERLTAFATHATESMVMARALSEEALAHFMEHGQLGPLQDFYKVLDTTVKNYIRKQAFVAWVSTFAPLKLDKGVFVKDKERAGPGNLLENPVWVASLEKAKSESFWNFSPEKDLKDYDAAAVIASIDKVFKALEKRPAKTPEALETLNRAKAHFERFNSANRAEAERQAA